MLVIQAALISAEQSWRKCLRSPGNASIFLFLLTNDLLFVFVLLAADLIPSHTHELTLFLVDMET